MGEAGRPEGKHRIPHRVDRVAEGGGALGGQGHAPNPENYYGVVIGRPSCFQHVLGGHVVARRQQCQKALVLDLLQAREGDSGGAAKPQCPPRFGHELRVPGVTAIDLYEQATPIGVRGVK